MHFRLSFVRMWLLNLPHADSHTELSSWLAPLLIGLVLPGQ
jgi:hypothetical protein